MKSDMERLVASLTESYRTSKVITKIDSATQPGRDIIVEILEDLKKVIFPGFFELKHLKSETITYYIGDILEEVRYNLVKQIIKAFKCCGEEKTSDEILRARAVDLCNQFLDRLVDIREVLATDVEAAYDGDPAAYSKDEIVYSYPGIYAIMVYRLAHELHVLGVPLIPRIMTECAHSRTGIDIHPGATIGRYFFIDHGTGIVIGETTIIGEHVKVYQGVTLGGLSTSGGQLLKGVRRHPTIEDDVTIYSGASIMGGKTVIGKGTVVGGNAFVTQSVPPNTRVIAKTVSVHYPISDIEIEENNS